MVSSPVLTAFNREEHSVSIPTSSVEATGARVGGLSMFSALLSLFFFSRRPLFKMLSVEVGRLPPLPPLSCLEIVKGGREVVREGNVLSAGMELVS